MKEIKIKHLSSIRLAKIKEKAQCWQGYGAKDTGAIGTCAPGTTFLKGNLALCAPSLQNVRIFWSNKPTLGMYSTAISERLHKDMYTRISVTVLSIGKEAPTAKVSASEGKNHHSMGLSSCSQTPYEEVGADSVSTSI